MCSSYPDTDKTGQADCSVHKVLLNLSSGKFLLVIGSPERKKSSGPQSKTHIKLASTSGVNIITVMA